MPLSENQAKVLGALFAEAERLLPVREIVRMTDLSEHITSRAVAALQDSGLAAGTGRGWRITGTGKALFRKPVYREYGH